MASFLSDQEVVERVLTHIENGTTDKGSEVWQEPVENYLSQERFSQEIQLLQNSTIPFCPSAALPEPGSYIARNASGVPILAVRGKDGQVRAFKNACRHRGTEVAQGSGCAKAFVCPYHGWAYGLDGQLQHVPHEQGFPELDKATMGLRPVHAEESSGLVLINQNNTASKSDPLAGLGKVLPPGLDLIDTHFTEAKVNWKVSLEGSLEGYHIRYGHKDSFYPYGFDNLNLVEKCEKNSRVTFPFRRIEKLRDIPKDERNIDGRLTYIYHLYPNALIAVLSHHMDVIILEPMDVDRTMMVAYTLANTGGNPEAMERTRKDAEFVNQSGAPEDLALVESVQRSINSGANEHFIFGHYEEAIVHLHRNLTASLKALAEDNSTHQ